MKRLAISVGATLVHMGVNWMLYLFTYGSAMAAFTDTTSSKRWLAVCKFFHLVWNPLPAFAGWLSQQFGSGLRSWDKAVNLGWSLIVGYLVGLWFARCKRV